MTQTCKWCSTPFTGPAKKKFCSNRCRNAFHKAARKWTEALIEAGFLTPEMIKRWEAEGMPVSSPYTARGA